MGSLAGRAPHRALPPAWATGWPPGLCPLTCAQVPLLPAGKDLELEAGGRASCVVSPWHNGGGGGDNGLAWHVVLEVKQPRWATWRGLSEPKQDGECHGGQVGAHRRLITREGTNPVRKSIEDDGS